MPWPQQPIRSPRNIAVRLSSEESFSTLGLPPERAIPYLTILVGHRTALFAKFQLPRSQALPSQDRMPHERLEYPRSDYFSVFAGLLCLRPPTHQVPTLPRREHQETWNFRVRLRRS